MAPGDSETGDPLRGPGPQWTSKTAGFAGEKGRQNHGIVVVRGF